MTRMAPHPHPSSTTGPVVALASVTLAALALALGSALAVTPAASSGARQHAGPSVHAATTTSAPSSIAPIVDVVADAATGGYWLVASDGAVFTFNAGFFGCGGGAPAGVARRGHGRHP